jgi:threonylcarbamoyladenosine tRNA methylthiotransferase MtaB
LGFFLKTVFVKTLGCKVNSFDSQALEHQFRSQGFRLLDNHVGADVTVINTCSVTAIAEKEARYLLRRYSRESPESLRVVTGCYAQIDSGRIVEMPEVDFVIPNEVKDNLVPLLIDRMNSESLSKFPESLKLVSDNKQTHFKSSVTLFDHPHSDRTRSYLKIQDGCNGFCAYCQIPLARGVSRSVPGDDILAKMHALVERKVPEIILTGIHLGDYGKDLEPSSHYDFQARSPLVTLLEKIFKIPGLQRIKLSSLEPSEVNEPLLQILAQNRAHVGEHFHFPLQSGADEILKKMGRQYDTKLYRSTVERVRAYFPEAQITADVIPGFPGETEELFEQTIQFIKSIHLNGLHVFPYSKRPNTRALRMLGHLSSDVIKARSRILRELSQELQHSYVRQFIGKTVPVLWESTVDQEGRIHGKTSSGIPVWTKNSEVSEGETHCVVLKGFVKGNDLFGTIRKV